MPPSIGLSFKIAKLVTSVLLRTRRNFIDNLWAKRKRRLHPCSFIAGVSGRPCHPAAGHLNSEISNALSRDWIIVHPFLRLYSWAPCHSADTARAHHFQSLIGNALVVRQTSNPFRISNKPTFLKKILERKEKGANPSIVWAKQLVCNCFGVNITSLSHLIMEFLQLLGLWKFSFYFVHEVPVLLVCYGTISPSTQTVWIHFNLKNDSFSYSSIVSPSGLGTNFDFDSKLKVARFGCLFSLPSTLSTLHWSEGFAFPDHVVLSLSTLANNRGM